MQAKTICIFCDQPTVRVRLTNHLEAHYRLLYPSTIQDLLELLKKNEIACIIAYPIQNGICRLWQFREIKEKFEVVPLIIACAKGHLDLFRSCADTLADESVDFEEMAAITERVESTIERHSFLKDVLIDNKPVLSHPPRMTKALKIIHSGFTKIKFAEDVSTQLGISVATFRKEFTQFFRITFTQYLIRIRLLYATYLAQNNGLSAKTIALRCGFNDQHQFYRCFKRKTGMTFSRYRKSYTYRDLGRFEK